MRTHLSETELHYLKAIYLLQQEGEQVTTRRLAQRLGVRPASVSAKVRHLSEENESGGPYVAHTPYQSIALTARGQEAALELIRHQRLLELFLLETLDMPWDTVHDEAERLAPYISEELEERIAARLGHPTRDPHGAPIPTPEGLVNDTDDVSLGDLEIGTEATIVRVPDQEADLLRYVNVPPFRKRGLLRRCRRGPRPGQELFASQIQNHLR
ncbi:MAG: metal-dependent transcriptional regulator [Ktedonobacteraceae bacterium]|nr:metal-dependent transcriptional regulator [Ktedonobacteraceae bacterium]